MRRLWRIDPGRELEVDGFAGAGGDRQHDPLSRTHLEHAELPGVTRKAMRTGQLVPATGFSVIAPVLAAADRSTTSVLRFQYCG